MPRFSQLHSGRNGREVAGITRTFENLYDSVAQLWS